MRIIGIDPGLSFTGFAIIDVDGKSKKICEYGSIRTNPEDSLGQRLDTIFEQINTVLHKWNPEIIVIEDVFIKPNAPQLIIHLGEVRGIIILAAYKMGVDVLLIKPTEVKSALTASGRADKEQIERVVRKIFELDSVIKPSHASDALALALTGAFRSGSLKHMREFKS